MAYICYGLNLVQTHRRKIHQYGEQRLNIRSYSCVFLGNVLMIKMRILVKTFVVYALPLLSHQSYNSANMTCSDELINFCYVKNWKSHLWRMFMMQRKIWGVGTNYDILIMKFSSVIFHRLSCVPPSWTCAGQWAGTTSKGSSRGKHEGARVSGALT